MRRLVALVVVTGWVTTWVAGCAPSTPALGAHHPANPAAPTGRLAGAPVTLRPGVVDYPDVPALRTGPAPMHHHHGS
ncbi:MAG: hypothetical protein ABI467_10560 [Kofleriaceae bacterium]